MYTRLNIHSLLRRTLPFQIYFTPALFPFSSPAVAGAVADRLK